MHPDPSGRRFLKHKGERLGESLPGSEPDVLAGTHIDVGFENISGGGTDFGIDAVGSDDQVVVAVNLDGADLGLEVQDDAERLGPVLQDTEQGVAADPAEAMTPGTLHGAAIVDGDVVPIDEVLANFGSAFRVVAGKVGERFVGQHDAPTEGVIGLVALDHDNVVPGIPEFHQDREIKARRSATQTRDTHEHLRGFSGYGEASDYTVAQLLQA